jgi:hypothetical protein
MIYGDIEASYKAIVEPHLSMCTKITLERSELKEIAEVAIKLAEVKEREGHYIEDPKSVLKRWVTGWAGELAVEKHLGVRFSDRSIGASKDYNVPDLSPLGFRVGVKTVNAPDFPLMKKPSPSCYISEGQIVVVHEGEGVFTIAGLAPLEALNEAKSYRDDLVKASGVLRRGEKSAFHKFSMLNPHFSIEDLKQYRLTTSP